MRRDPGEVVRVQDRDPPPAWRGRDHAAQRHHRRFRPTQERVPRG